MIQKKDLIDRLKGLGIEVINAAKKEYQTVISGTEKQFSKEKLRKRFNQENPYKFVLLDGPVRIKIIDNLLARHAKRYNEDDILVFFGTKKENHFKPSQRIKDLSDNIIYEIVEVVEVMIPITLNNKDIEVPCTAIYGKVIS
ncbi:MAG: hypothetical protein B6I17_03720 [Tenericutes bacterium 4572_104]|nr:MAG: hypothetical protein B6I17_03720 [Tenericutes bacterium 4572_104]